MRYILIILLIIIFCPSEGLAFWVWTPETNKWVNPKYAVKESPQLQLEFSLEFYEAQDYGRATKELRKLLQHYPKAREAAEAQYYLGRSFEELENYTQAFNEYQLVIERYPFSDRAGEIVERQFAIGNIFLEGKAKRNKIVKVIAGGDYDVIDVFRKVIKNSPYGKYAAVSQYKIGLYLLEKQLFQEARDEFEKTINDYPDSEWAKAAKYQIAVVDAERSSEAQYDQKVTKVAVEELEDFIETHPEADFSDDAREKIRVLREKEAENSFLIAEFYEKQKKYSAAKMYYSSIIDDYRNTSWAQKALAKIQNLSRKIEKYESKKK